MEIDTLIDNVKVLYGTYGWWSIAIVVVVMALMIPVNFGIKKAFEKQTDEKIVRLRKLISAVLVFVVAIAVLYFFEWVFGDHNYNIGYILTNCIPVALMTMVLWTIIKVIRDIGFLPFIRWISGKLSESKYFKEMYAAIEIDDKIKDTIYSALTNMIGKNTDGTTEKIDEYFNANKQVIYNFIKSTLSCAKESADAKQVMDQFHALFTVTNKEEEII